MTGFGRDAYGATAPVGGFPASRPVGAIAAGYTGEGFHDLGGNVWEWTADAAPLQGEAPAARGANPLRTEGDGRVSRGGGWDDSAAVWVRTGARSLMAPGHRYDNRGGRCASAPVR